MSKIDGHIRLRWCWGKGLGHEFRRDLEKEEVPMNENRNFSIPYVVAVVFVLSAAMLAYEILLTRIASVLLTSQYLFLIIGVLCWESPQGPFLSIT